MAPRKFDEDYEEATNSSDVVADPGSVEAPEQTETAGDESCHEASGDLEPSSPTGQIEHVESPSSISRVSFTVDNVIETFSTADGRKVADYPEYRQLFRDLSTANEFLRNQYKRWTPNDQAVPDEKTQEGSFQILHCVEKITKAMTDMTEYEDKTPEPGKRCLAIMVPGRVSDATVQARAWQVVNATIQLHKNGCSLVATADIATQEDKNLTFDQRITAVCKTLRTWKSCVQDCLDGAKLDTVVHAPNTAALRKANNKRNNLVKGQDLQVGSKQRKSLGEDDTPSKRGRKSKLARSAGSPAGGKDEPTVEDDLDEEMETTKAGPTSSLVSHAISRVAAMLKREDDQDDGDHDGDDGERDQVQASENCQSKPVSKRKACASRSQWTSSDEKRAKRQKQTPEETVTAASDD